MRKNTLTTPEGKEFKFNIPENTKTDRRGFYKTNTKEFMQENDHIDFEYISHDLKYRGLNEDNDFYERNGIKLPVVDFRVQLLREPLKSKSDNWQETAHHWLIIIKDQHFDYFTGSGLVIDLGHGRTKPKPPSIEDVLYCLIMDADACEMSFQEWCSVFGYDSDSIKALETYHDCQKNADKLRKAGIVVNDDMRKYFEDF